MDETTYTCQICKETVRILDQPSHMDGHQDGARKAVYFGAEIVERIFGTADALDNTDAITAALIVAHAESRPALGKADKIALVAIAALAEHDPDQARSLITELM